MSAPDAEQEQPFLSHLLELRDRILRMVLAVAVVTVALLPFANSIYTFVAQPLMAQMPAGTTMIATEVASPFLAPFKLTLVVAIFVAIPYLLHQLWAFVAPGLYAHERSLMLPLLASSVLLFYLGAAFAYFFVFPMIFGFFTATAPQGVAVMTDINHYLDFVLTLFFAFGVAFEVPIAVILLVWAGVIEPDKLKEMRPYVIVGAFVIGMFLTPPDVFSQTLLAVPMWLLFEAGLLASRFIVRRRDPLRPVPPPRRRRPALRRWECRSIGRSPRRRWRPSWTASRRKSWRRARARRLASQRVRRRTPASSRPGRTAASRSRRPAMRSRRRSSSA